MDGSPAPLPFPPARPGNTVAIVTGLIEERILNGTLRSGEMLPSEEQLALQMQVGRRSVREALKVLQAKGLIEVRMGVGTTVRRNDLDNFLDALSRNMGSYLRLRRADVRHVSELREIIEGMALEQLAREPQPQLLQRLTEHLQGQRAALAADDIGSYQRRHFDFHTDVVDTRGNPVISMIYRQVLALVHNAMAEAVRRPGVMEQAIAEHQMILDALTAGQPQQVRQYLTQHLQSFISNLDQTDNPATENAENTEGAEK